MAHLGLSTGHWGLMPAPTVAPISRQKKPRITGAESKKQGFTVLKNAAIVFQQGNAYIAEIGPTLKFLVKQRVEYFCGIGCKHFRQESLCFVVRITTRRRGPELWPITPNQD